MKNLCLLLLTIAFISFAKGNIAPPRALITEVFFETNGNWAIEMGFSIYDISEIDSFRIETSAGSSRIISYTLIYGGGFPNFDSIAVISDSNLSAPLTINPNYDYIKLITYVLGGNSYYDYVAIGNYPGSMLDCLQNGESVSFLSYIQSAGYTSSFCIDKSPTIGFANDTTGALSTISGVIYNLNDSVFTEGFFPLPGAFNTTIHINSDGTFSERVFSRRYTFDTIRIYFPPSPYTKLYYTIEHFDICLRPDSGYQNNIYTTSLVLNSDEMIADFEKVTVSPNPFTNSLIFYFNLKNTNPFEELLLSIFNPDGRLIKQIKIPANQNKYVWIPDESIPSGMLLYNLTLKDQLLSSGKLVKL